MCGSDHDTAVSLSTTATTQILPLVLLYGKEAFLTNWLRFSILVTFLSFLFFFVCFFFSRLRLFLIRKQSLPNCQCHRWQPSLWLWYDVDVFRYSVLSYFVQK